jgi:anhydro-N-acetylmuramic acid kinase
VLNLGGIANISAWPRAISKLQGNSHELDEPIEVLGFDTGPANTLMDLWIARHQNKAVDLNGDWAASGTCNEALLDLMLSEPYFSKTFPKSTGKELFNLKWLDDKINTLGQMSESALSGKTETVAIAPDDVQCTLAHLTAKSVANEVDRLGQMKTLAVCGGGVHNQFLMTLIAQYLPTVNVVSTAEYLVCPDSLEAAAFAWLAYCRINKIQASAPSITGARSAAVLGAWVTAR